METEKNNCEVGFKIKKDKTKGATHKVAPKYTCSIV